MLERLPKPPGWRWSGFGIAQKAVEGSDLIEWILAIQNGRPGVPTGIAYADSGEADRSTAAFALLGKLDPAPFTLLAKGGRLGSGPFRRLASSVVERAIAEAWECRWPVADRATRELLRTVAAHGVRGGTAASMSAYSGSLGIPSQSSIRRRLAAEGLPPLGWLLRDARVSAVPTRIERGQPDRAALRASGWFTKRAYARVCATHRPFSLKAG